MKKRNALLALIIMIALLTAACSGGGGGGNQASGSENSSNTAGSDASTPVEIVYAFPVYGVIPPDLKMVEDEINKISIPEINVKVKMLPISGGSWEQQINLMISSGEKLDLMPAMGTYNSMIAQRQLLDMTELLEQYGQGIVEALGKNFLKGTTINGKIYGV